MLDSISQERLELWRLFYEQLAKESREQADEEG